MDLPTYVYDRMSQDEKRRLLTEDIKEPVVIRGLYQPKARNMSFEQVIKLFGLVELPVEVYDSPESKTTDAYTTTMSVPDLIKHWKKGRSPSLYCAEVDLFEQRVTPQLLKTLKNPNTSERKVGALMLYLGNNHSSGLHLHVQSDFILNQLYGTKTVYICDDPRIQKNSVFSPTKSNFAKEDFFKMDHSKMNVYKVTLEPGDSLLIPPWSWHATQGHGINMSLTQIFERKDRSYLLKHPGLLIDYLSDDYLTIALVLIVLFMLFRHVR